MGVYSRSLEAKFGLVVSAMRENLASGITLADMADIAYLSPFHFLRVFRQAFGVAPGHFFTALRMEAAKQLLRTTTESVVDVCFSVGYSSPSTFSTRFAQLVGETPRAYRALCETFFESGIWEASLGATPLSVSSAGSRMGRILGPLGFKGLIFVGAFSMRCPQALPLAGVLLREPGPYHLHPIADGLYYILVAAVPREEPESLFVPGQRMLVGSGTQRLVISHGSAVNPVDIHLRPPCNTDPPIVVALPTLLERQVARISLTAAAAEKEQSRRSYLAL
jgi:AraC family transcriptional regulator